MSIQVNQVISLASGATFDIGVVQNKVCIILKVTDPSQVIVVDAATQALPVTKNDVQQIFNKSQATNLIYNNIVTS